MKYAAPCIQLGKKFGYRDVRSRKKQALMKICDDHGLLDHVTLMSASTNTSPVSFWRRNTEDRQLSTNEVYQASRLDHVLTTYNNENINTKFLRFYPSDHAITETHIKIKARSGMTPWRLNRPSIDDPAIQAKIKRISKSLTKNLKKVESKLIMSRLNDHEQSKILGKIAMNKWVSLLNYTKTITSKWERAEAEKKSSEIRNLIKCMNNLEVDNDSYNELVEEFNVYEIEKYKIKTELYKFKNKFDNKGLLKYKAQVNMSNRTMKKITIDNTSYENDNEIRKALTAHFTSTFSCYCEEQSNRCVRCTHNNLRYLKNIKPPINSAKKLSNSERSDLEKEIDNAEIEKYVKMKLKKEGKAPGPDGIPYAFVYKFWNEIKYIVTKVVKITLNKNIMPNSLAKGLVIFLPKPGKDQEKVNGWRPLTMLKSIYKICSCLIASRLEKKIEQIIHKHQYGFVKKRQAADVIKMLNILIRENNEKTLAIVGMDFRGAFDTVKHEAIIRALRRKNFEPKFTNMVATLLAKNESTISVNW